MLGRLRTVPVLLFLALNAGAETVVIRTVTQPYSPVTPLVNPLAPALPGEYIPAGSISGVLGKKRFVSDEFKSRAFLDAKFDGNFRPQSDDAIPPVVAPAPAQPATDSGKALLDRLHSETGKGYKPHNYDDARDYMYGTADQVTVNGKKGLLDPYSGVFVQGRSRNGGDYPEDGDENGDGYRDHKGFNAEHIWPQSFFDQRSPMRSDLHHLMATFIHTNEVRGHLPFGEVEGKPEYSNRGGAKMGGGIFEPPDAAKGRVARAVLYFWTRYHNQNVIRRNHFDHFIGGRLEMFLRWNREHPPTQFEKDRNDLVQAFQGNRNPFTDDPTLADRIGVEGFRSGMTNFSNKNFRPNSMRSDRDRYQGKSSRHKKRRWR